MSNEVTSTITVSRDALYKVLHALVGPAHHIRELQATRSLHALGHPNPIDILIEQFNACAPTAQAAPVTQRDAQTAGLIAAAEHIEGMASGYLQEHAYTEPDTGAVVFDRSDAGEDYYNTLVELAEDLRAMVVYSRDQAQEGASHD